MKTTFYFFTKRFFVAVAFFITSLISNDEIFAQRYMSIDAPGIDPAAQLSIPSPTASGFAEYVVNPVGHYTGVPSISIPLYSIQLKDYTLPISLSYHAGGIRIDETASNVGLGWTLAAGGVITRSIRDRPDDATIDQCNDSWYYVSGVNKPLIARDGPCGNGLLWALSEPANANYDGLDSYDIDISAYNGVLNSSTAAMKLIKKFYGIAQFSGSNDIYMKSMADKEPDIFYFNFAGRTGQFVFDMSSGTPVVRTFPYQDLKIEHFTGGGQELSSFKITDEKGVMYTFGAIETTVTNYSANTVPQAEDIYLNGWGLSYHVNKYETGHGRTEHRTSWFLTRIETPLGDYLDFSYVSEAYEIVTRGPQQTGLFYMLPGAMSYNPNDLTSAQSNTGYYNSLKINKATIYGKRLAKIENNKIKVEVLAPEQREDLVSEQFYSEEGLVEGANAISEIVVYNKIGEENRIKKIKLDQDYFVSDASEYINKYYKDYPDQYDIFVSDSSRYYKRLRLRSVQEFGQDDEAHIPPFVFEYKYADFTGNAIHKLPHRLSYQQDIWGYYNGASGNNTLIPSIYVYPDHYPIKDSRQFRLFRMSNFTGAEYYLPAGNRLPNPNLVDIGVLSKIVYPTKGSTEFQFESNVFRDEGQDYSGGGLRIKKIIQHDDFNPAVSIIHTYSYVNEDNTSSGCVVSLPVMAIRNFPNIFALSPNSEEAYKTYTVRYSQPQMPLSTTNGSFVGYRRVTESTEGNGKTVYTFSMPASWHVENDIPVTSPTGVCDPAVDGHCDGLYQLTPVIDLFSTSVAGNLDATNYDFSQSRAAPNTFPFPENPNYDWQRGHLLKESTFTSTDDPVKEVLYFYENYFPGAHTLPVSVYGYKFSSHYPLLTSSMRFPAAHVFRIAKYPVLTEVGKVLKSKKEIVYSAADPSKYVSSEVIYDYENEKLKRATSTTFTDSRGRVIKHVQEYSHDVLLDELGSDLLLQRHIHDTPLRQIRTVNGSPVSKVEHAFFESNGKAVIRNLLSYSNGTTMFSRTENEYDNNTNLVQVTPVFLDDANGVPLVSGTSTSYIWGYGDTRLIAVTENAKYTDTYHENFEGEEGNSSIDDSKTGHKSKAGGFSMPLSGLTNGLYRLTYWKKVNNDWALHEETTSVTSGNYQISITGQVDDVRFHPASAEMTTYTYDPGIGMTSTSDPNNRVTYYQYNNSNRLTVVQDTEKDVLKAYEYRFKE